MSQNNEEPQFEGNLAVEMTGLPILSELEYYLISELVTMPNRKLAEAIELDIFDKRPQARTDRLQLYLQALARSEDGGSFWKYAEAIASTAKHPFVQDKL